MGAEPSVPEPPFSPELIADLHADALPPRVAEQLWPVVRKDPEALRILAALDGVSGALSQLGADRSIGTPIPPDVAAGLDRVLAESSPAVDLSARRRRWAIVASAAAAVVVAISIVVAVVTVQRPSESPSLAGPETSGRLDLGTDLAASTVFAVLGRNERPGMLADPAVLRGCFTANGVSPTAPILGSAAVRFDGKDAVLLLTAGKEPTHVLALVVGTECNANDPQTLASAEIG